MPEAASPAAVIGDGGWGTAIALVLHERGRPVRIWGHAPAYLDEMRRSRENRLFLPGVGLPSEIAFEPDLGRALAGATLILVAVPTRFLRSVLAPVRGQAGDATVVSLTKGIEPETLRRPSRIVTELLGTGRVVVVSGPSHAEEVARRLPTTVVAAAGEETLAREVQEALMTPAFRVYTSADLAGVELGGALKNVIALAAGIAIGLGLGDNALAALMTRGLSEIGRLAAALGANPRTLAGLSGMGDLITTCVSPHGRNRRVGIELGRGRRLAEILAGSPQVAEGVTTALSASALGRQVGVELPIVDQVCLVLYEDKPPRQAVADLMAREGKAE